MQRVANSGSFFSGINYREVLARPGNENYIRGMPVDCRECVHNRICLDACDTLQKCKFFETRDGGSM